MNKIKVYQDCIDWGIISSLAPRPCHYPHPHVAIHLARVISQRPPTIFARRCGLDVWRSLLVRDLGADLLASHLLEDLADSVGLSQLLVNVCANRVECQTYNFLAGSAISRDFLALRAAEFLCAHAEGFVEVIGLSAGLVVGIHFFAVCVCGVVAICEMW
jgi:hypothetical protein